MPARLDEIEGRLALATDGPWVEYDARVFKIRPECLPEELCDTSLNGNSAADGDLIANSPSDLAYLLRVARAAERLQETVDALMALTDPVVNVAPLNEARAALRHALDGTTK